jgi:hypothetical protein
MAEKSKATLASDLAANFADGGLNTAAEFRAHVGDILDSITATLKTTGAGTDYTLTGSSALVDFGTTDPTLAIPGAGTFQIIATIQLVADAAGAGDVVRFKLRNTTDGADIGIEREVTMPANSAQVPVQIIEHFAPAAAKTVQLWAYNATSARGTVISTKTEIKSVRLA